MRVLLMLEWNRGRGGAEAHALRLREGLMAAGDEVRLLVSDVGSAGDGLADYVSFGTEKRLPLTVLQIANPLAAATARRAMKEFRPDAVWVNMFALQLSPAAIFALGDVPKVLFVSDYKVICPVSTKLLPKGENCEVRAGAACLRSGCLSLPHWLRDQARYALIRRAVNGFDTVIGCSEWVRKELAQEDIPSDVLPVTIAAPPADFRRVPDATPTLLYCGRLDEEKGVDLLVRAFAQVQGEFPEARLRLAGQGPCRAGLEQLARQLGVNAEFLGWRDPPDLEPEYARAWALAAPSRWAEPLGLVAVEAIARGLPAIVPDRGGLAEVVTAGESGWHFASGDEFALADCLRQAFRRPQFVPESLIAEARERFGLAAHVSQLRGTFHGLISRHARVRGGA